MNSVQSHEGVHQGHRQCTSRAQTSQGKVSFQTVWSCGSEHKRRLEVRAWQTAAWWFVPWEMRSPCPAFCFGNRRWPGQQHYWPCGGVGVRLTGCPGCASYVSGIPVTILPYLCLGSGIMLARLTGNKWRSRVLSLNRHGLRAMASSFVIIIPYRQPLYYK